MFQLNFFQQFALLTKPYKCQKLHHLDVLREKKLTQKVHDFWSNINRDKLTYSIKYNLKKKLTKKILREPKFTLKRAQKNSVILKKK